MINGFENKIWYSACTYSTSQSSNSTNFHGVMVSTVAQFLVWPGENRHSCYSRLLFHDSRGRLFVVVWYYNRMLCIQCSSLLQADSYNLRLNIHLVYGYIMHWPDINCSLPAEWDVKQSAPLPLAIYNTLTDYLWWAMVQHCCTASHRKHKHTRTDIIVVACFWIVFAHHWEFTCVCSM